jgi:hypothetical protein
MTALFRLCNNLPVDDRNKRNEEIELEKRQQLPLQRDGYRHTV